MTSKRKFPCLGALAMLFATTPALGPPVAAAEEFGPQGVVRHFCRADGMGSRLRPLLWPEVARVVDWELEPAWDHVVLIAGYEIGNTRSAEDGTIAVDVRYDVVGTVSAFEFDPNTRVEKVTFRVHAPDEGRWRIIGPPPAPHVFGNQVRTAELRRLLQSQGGFISNTIFVWEMFRSAGWDVPYRRTFELLDGSVFGVVTEPGPGDLLVYLRDGRPYHVGLLESGDVLVSSTVNAGVLRTRADAFPGVRRHLRLLEPKPARREGDTPRNGHDGSDG